MCRKDYTRDLSLTVTVLQVPLDQDFTVVASGSGQGILEVNPDSGVMWVMYSYLTISPFQSKSVNASAFIVVTIN